MGHVMKIYIYIFIHSSHIAPSLAICLLFHQLIRETLRHKLQSGPHMDVIVLLSALGPGVLVHLVVSRQSQNQSPATGPSDIMEKAKLRLQGQTDHRSQSAHQRFKDHQTHTGKPAATSSRLLCALLGH